MGLGRIVGGTVAGLGLVGLGYTGLAGQDDTTRDESGAIVAEGEIGAFRIRLGDCLNGGATGLIESLDGVPCSQSHDLEVYHAFNLGEGDGTFPGEDEVASEADQGCFEAFEPFVGESYEDSVYGFSAMTPTEGSWDGLDDREVLCLLGNYDDTPKTGSAEGTAR